MNLQTTQNERPTSAWRLDCKIFAAAIRTESTLSISAWADKYRILSAEVSAEPGPWRTDRVPHTREIMDVLSPSDPTTEITFVAGTQVAKTETGNNFLGFIIDVAPGPAMMVHPTSGSGRRSSKTRLAMMIEAMPRLRAKISDKRRDRANAANLKMFPGGLLVIAGANSPTDLKSQPVRYIFEDEVDEYPDDLDGQGPSDELAEKRTDTYRRNKKIFRTSTPTVRGRSKIWRHFERSDQRRYYVPCPHCGDEQTLRTDQLRWEMHKIWETVDAESGEIKEVEEGTEGAQSRSTGELLAVWYECAHCCGRIEEYHKTEMLSRGRWIAENPQVKRHAGFHLNALYSPLGWFSWTQAVQKKLEADKDPSKALLRTWVQTVKGEPYQDVGESVSDIALKNREKTYRLETVPRGALMLTASADVQGNRLEMKVKGWGREKESWLVDYQVIFGDTENEGPTGPWAVLDEYRRRTYPHESGAELHIVAMAIDAGYRSQIVYDFCRKRIRSHVFPVRGQTQPGKTILGRPTKQDIDHNGKRIEKGINLWPVGTDTAKTEIFARLKIEHPGPGYMHFPLGLPDEYFVQLTSERLVSRYVRGYLKHSWEKTETIRNEALDLEVYAYAAAIYAGVQRINWDQLERSIRPKGAAVPEVVEASEAQDDAPKANPFLVSGKTWLPRRENWLRR